MNPDGPRILVAAPAYNPDWWHGGRVLAPPSALPVLESLTPKNYTTQLADGHVEEIDLEAKFDLVAISCMTAAAPAAYEVADAFMGRGIPVVMGGYHVSALPDEAGKHATSVVVGEAEPVWPGLLADFEAGRLKPIYQASEYHDLKDLPLPRRDLLRSKRYLTVNTVQTARGCPHACTFCSVSTVAGKKYRFRPVEEVIEELRWLTGWIAFVDDNIVGSHKRAKELFEALIPLRIRWVGQADLRIADDPELLRLAALSGCVALFIGLESLSEENLVATGKTPNVNRDMSAAIGKIHAAGIEIVGSFVLGLDGDDLTVFAKTVHFAKQAGLVAAQFSVLTPYPGTKMYDQLLRESRIFDQDWSHYTMSRVVFKPMQMTPEQLQQGRQGTYGSFYSLLSSFRRCFLVGRGNGWVKWLVNMSYRNIGHEGGLMRGLPSS